MHGEKSSGSCRCRTQAGCSSDENLGPGREQNQPRPRYASALRTTPKILVGHIAKGWRGTQQTVAHVQALIRAGAKDFYVRQKAIDIVLEQCVRPKDYLGEIQALFHWVQHHIRYTKDTVHVEVLHSAKRMLELRAGDCDDMTILLGAMLEAIGHPVRLVLSGQEPLKPDLFTHIYLEVFHRGRWIPLDATMPYPMGWAPSTPVKKIIAIERRANMMAEDRELQGLGGLGAVPDWLKGLLRAVRLEAMQPKDVRVKSLWDLLRQRQLLNRSPWLKAVLRRVWDRGLSARPHPRTARRIKLRLRHWGILPPIPVSAVGYRPAGIRARAQSAIQSVRPVVLKPVASVRPTTMQPVRPVQMKPVGMKAGGR